MAHQPVIKEKKPGLRRKVSRIWIVPVLALLVSVGVAAHQYLNRDMMIEIEFLSAAGMKEDKTEIRFNDVVVGHVKKIEFTEDLRRVNVTAAIEREMAQYIDRDATFWLVKAEITASRVTGLDTLLTGDYINAEWDSVKGDPAHKFIAEKDPPIVPLNEEGTRISLRSYEATSLTAGAPIYYRGVKVGIIRDTRLNPEGQAVTIAAFIYAPYDKFLSTETRFWNVSGIKADFGTNGLEVDMASVSTIIQGGIEFTNTISGGEAIMAGHEFDLYPDRDSAESSQIVEDVRGSARVSSVFSSSVKGLQIGADVQYRGLTIGRVESISAIANTDPNAKTALKLAVTYTIQPSRIGLGVITDPQQTYDALNEATQKQNLRARLVPQSLLGGLMIEIFEDEEATTSVGLDFDTDPFPTMPSTDTKQDGLSAAAETVLNKVADLRLQDALDDVSTLLRNINALVVDENTKRIPSEVATLFDNANEFVGGKDFQNIPSEINLALKDITAIIDELRQGQAAENLVAAIENLRDVAAKVDTASDDIPGIMENVDALVAKARDLPLDSLIESADQLVQSADDFVEESINQDLPKTLSGALGQVRDTLAELRAGGTTENLNETLRAASSAMESIQQASNRLPALVQRLNALSDQTSTTIEGFNPNSQIYRRTMATIDNINAASRSLDSLIRMIERKPNALLTGR